MLKKVLQSILKLIKFEDFPYFLFRPRILMQTSTTVKKTQNISTKNDNQIAKPRNTQIFFYSVGNFTRLPFPEGHESLLHFSRVRECEAVKQKKNLEPKSQKVRKGEKNTVEKNPQMQLHPPPICVNKPQRPQHQRSLNHGQDQGEGATRVRMR